QERFTTRVAGRAAVVEFLVQLPVANMIKFRILIITLIFIDILLHKHRDIMYYESHTKKGVCSGGWSSDRRAPD
ncbi:hypothetical protein CWB76_19440, partial [Pseudoalteromonas sp. S1609]|uniref:hypothetical protein n=1 Tax=Pseudoalteromonas sp. S1609 TaxID=579505 RepID=UPI00127A3858